MKNDVSIVISSCDKYHYLWDIQLQLLDRYWPDCPYNIYMISENGKLPDFKTNLKLYNFNTNKTPIGPSDWSNNLLEFLPTIDSKYIIYLQEDYVFTRNVDNVRLDILLKYININDINYVRFYTAPSGNGETINIADGVSIKEILKDSPWRSSLMVAIWKKDTLYTILTQVPGINPWQFEQCTNCNQFDKFYCINLPKHDDSDILPFLGMYGSSGGYTFYPAIVDLLNKEGIKKLNGEEINFNIQL